MRPAFLATAFGVCQLAWLLGRGQQRPRSPHCLWGWHVWQLHAEARQLSKVRWDFRNERTHSPAATPHPFLLPTSTAPFLITWKYHVHHATSIAKSRGQKSSTHKRQASPDPVLQVTPSMLPLEFVSDG